MKFIKVHQFKPEFQLEYMSDVLIYEGEVILNAEGITRINSSKYSYKDVKEPSEEIKNLNFTGKYTEIYAKYGREVDKYIVAETMQEIFEFLQ